LAWPNRKASFSGHSSGKPSIQPSGLRDRRDCCIRFHGPGEGDKKDRRFVDTDLGDGVAAQVARCLVGARQFHLGHSNKEVQSSDPQERGREPHHQRNADRKGIPWVRVGRRDNAYSLVHGRVHQHGEQQASIRVGVEPRDGDGKRDHLQVPDRERLTVLVSSLKKKDGQMPAGPDQPEQYARARESEATRQTGKSIAAPSDLFPLPEPV
jgi:hypothetical protein